MSELSTADRDAARDALAIVTAVLDDSPAWRQIVAESPSKTALFYAMTGFCAAAVNQLARTVHCDASEILQDLGLQIANHEGKGT